MKRDRESKEERYGKKKREGAREKGKEGRQGD